MFIELNIFIIKYHNDEINIRKLQIKSKTKLLFLSSFVRTSVFNYIKKIDHFIEPLSVQII